MSANCSPRNNLLIDYSGKKGGVILQFSPQTAEIEVMVSQLCLMCGST